MACHLTSVAMLWQTSHLLCSFLCFLTLHRVLSASSGLICKPGEMATHSRTSCIPCPNNQYRPKANQYIECLNCDPCVMYSIEVSPCTRTKNTQCRCREGFTPLDETQERCKCSLGSGIKTFGDGSLICEKCPTGTFTNTINTVCEARRQCVQSGEKVPGSAASDVDCRNESNVVVTHSPRLPVPETSANTSTTAPTKAPTIAYTSRNSVSPHTPSIPEPQDSRKHAFWLAPFAAILILSILILKFFAKKKNEMARQDSACGKPVEESGEKFLPPPV